MCSHFLVALLVEVCPCSPKSLITHKFSYSVRVSVPFLDLFPYSHVYHLSHFSFTFFDCYTERMYITLTYFRFMYIPFFSPPPCKCAYVILFFTSRMFIYNKNEDSSRKKNKNEDSSSENQARTLRKGDSFSFLPLYHY